MQFLPLRPGSFKLTSNEAAPVSIPVAVLMESIMPSDRSTARMIEKALREKSNSEKAAFYPKFFKAGKGEYAEGDKFLGVVVPDQRKIAKRFMGADRKAIQRLLESPYHECRLTGLLVLVGQFETTKCDSERKTIYSFYLDNVDRVNNWDLVDASAHKIVGEYLLDRSHQPLFTLARASHLWKNRIAMIATLRFIQNDQLDTTVELAQILLRHPHDLIHKAVGWMLREVGKRNERMLVQFLDLSGDEMPRTMLRYAIEKLPESKRQHYLAKGKSRR
jgi:3-methyladenine DNA glycosylase AlkD